MTDADHKNPWQVLALLRFLLAMIVVCGHLQSIAPGHPATLPGNLGGFAAVIGFLIISGYSIAHSIDRRPHGFYRRRVLRIYPLYVSAVFFSLVPFLIAHSRAISTIAYVPTFPTIKVFFLNLVMLQNFTGKTMTCNPPLWTLPIEFAWYLTAPLLARLHKTALLAIIAASAILFITRLKLTHDWDANPPLGLGILFLGWAWVGGFAFYHSHKIPLAAVVLVAASLLMIVLCGKPGEDLGPVTIGVAAMMVALAPKVSIPAWVAAVCDFLGDLSYPLYLVHVPSLLIAHVLGLRNPWLLLIVPILFSAAFLAGDAMFKQTIKRRVRPESVPTPA
jgi:peptidoglycan/LPS O-acetylase OafA/YrhL